MATKAEIEMAKALLILITVTIGDVGADAYLGVNLQAIQDLADEEPSDG